MMRRKTETGAIASVATTVHRPLRLTRRAAAAALLVLAGAAAAAAAAPDAPGSSVYTEELTSTELADRIAGGATTILLPIGGTEQNGPHMVLGKHNQRVRLLAAEIARQLGQTLVAPVLAYVPEGAIDPPAGHMRFAGTISIAEAAFEAVLESAGRSFRQHGFREVVFIGDHGGYQASLARVAARLDSQWQKSGESVYRAGDRAGAQARAAAVGSPPRALALAAYYRASVDGHAELLRAKGFAKAEIGSHAGLADTALTLAVDPSLVRSGQLQRAAQGGELDGVHGDPRRATAELGRIGVALIVERSVAAIRAHRGPR